MTLEPEGVILAPAFTESIETHADWVEFEAVCSETGYYSWSDFKRIHRIGRSVDAIEEIALDDDEALDVLVSDVSSELDYRKRHCGPGEQYPFDVEPDGVQYADADRLRPVYVFLLMLSMGVLAGTKRATKVFEEVAGEALVRYFGGRERGVNVRIFGFPRRLLPKGFSKAVDTLTREMNEGEGCHGSPELPDQKDAFLDLVAWRSFSDKRAGQLVAFGQCATGNNWHSKISELRPRDWCKLWLNRPLSVDPLAFFFVPHRVEEKWWRRTTVYGGILFDRCRITSMSESLVVEAPEPYSMDELRDLVGGCLSRIQVQQ